MFQQFESRQHQVLTLLQQHKSGFTIDDLVTRLEISRTAVNQHMAGLEQKGLIKKSTQQKVTAADPGGPIKLQTRG